MKLILKTLFITIILVQLFWLLTINSYNMISNISLFIIYGFWAIYCYKKLKNFEKNSPLDFSK